MEIRPQILVTIIGAAVVTLVPRVLPLVLLRRWQMPQWLQRWLGYVPISILSALLARELLLVDGQLALPPHHLAIVAIWPALVVAVVTRNLMGTVLTGIAAMLVLRLLFA